MKHPPEAPTPAWSRRAALRALALGGAAVAAGLGAAPAARAAAQAPRRLVLHNTHTLESLTVELAAGDGYRPDALDAVNRVLRDHRNGAVHPIDPALLGLLHAIAGRCEHDAEFEVISGYRSPESNAAMHARSAGVAAHSLHVEGRAIDVRLVGCPLERLRDAGLGLAVGGVGYYRGPQFVHLDTGRIRSWVG
ncbi:MAG: DUF882 domain-containing protein [Proteobacteria bacterium]|nr:DUF882 domain-containing protein [Pseudomonadota bacterium]